MKKLTALTAAAALLLAACSCDSKGDADTDEPIGDITLAEETTATAVTDGTVLTKYDFTQLDCEITFTEDNGRSHMSSIDISGLSFGERLSPCKAPEVCEEYVAHPEKDIEEARRKLTGTPCAGSLKYAAELGGKYYFAVNFDDLCGKHDSSVFSYSPETGELNETAQRSGLDYSGAFNGLTSGGGKLWFYENGDSGGKVFSLDPATGEAALFTERENASVHALECTDSDILVEWSVPGETDHIIDYSAATKEQLSDIEAYEPARYICDGKPAKITGGNDDFITIETQYYTLTTELKEHYGIFLWKDKVCLISDTKTGHWLYTYDITKRERIKIHFADFSTSGVEKFGDQLVCLKTSYTDASPTTELSIIDPITGISTRCSSFGSYILGGGSDSHFLISMRNITDSSFTFASGYENATAPDTLFFPA